MSKVTVKFCIEYECDSFLALGTGRAGVVIKVVSEVWRGNFLLIVSTEVSMGN